MALRIALPDMISPSYFPVIAAVELGFFADEGLDATVELVFPVAETFRRLQSGAIDLAAGSAHAALYVFPGWRGCKLLCALSKNMYWFLVVRADLAVPPGDLTALRGLRIAAAPGPVDGLREMLSAAGIDPDSEVEIGPVPGTASDQTSFGVAAADALASGAVDGFWANGMGAEIAVRSGTGTVVVDARRGDGPAGSTGYTFPALVASDRMISHRPGDAAAAVRAVAAAQRALRADPGRAETAARRHFPSAELGLIAGLVARDSGFYETAISEEEMEAVHTFARRLGILSSDPVAYEQAVATDLPGTLNGR